MALSPLELAAGYALDQVGDAEPLRLGPGVGQCRTEGGPRQALEREVLQGLCRPPCLVSFSGGRDSSAVLAVASTVARREGLADPVPVTERYPGVASTQESDWQEMVIRHLGLDSWERLEINHELDLAGDIACDALRAHGLLWPPNAYLHVPMLDLARGGSLLSGLDGDGLLGNWRWLRAQQALHRQVRPQPRDALRVALAMSPAYVRRHRMGIDVDALAPWLRPGARRQVGALMAAEAAAEPRRWDDRVAWYPRRRYLHLAVHSLGLLAGAREVALHHPLLGAGFLEALGRQGGAGGLGDRTSLMGVLAGDLLPAAVVSRVSKAEFGRAIWRERARSFAEGWTGEGVDADLVDPGLLRAEWHADNPRFASSTLLHAAWLATRGPAVVGHRQGG